MDNEKYINRCYELAIKAGKKGFDTFGAILVHNGEILEEAENTADWNKGLFGHAEFNLVHKCANRYSDTIGTGERVQSCGNQISFSRRKKQS